MQRIFITGGGEPPKDDIIGNHSTGVEQGGLDLISSLAPAHGVTEDVILPLQGS